MKAKSLLDMIDACEDDTELLILSGFVEAKIGSVDHRIKENKIVIKPKIVIASLMGQIEQAIKDYHYALDMRQHGGVAQDKAFNQICKIMNLRWEQGKERKSREASEN